MSDEKFYVCYVEGETAPEPRVYLSLQLAKGDAGNIAKQTRNQGKNVYIMESTLWCQCPSIPVYWGDV